MKITKNAQTAIATKRRKELANEGCQTCPCCGESKTFLQYLKENQGFKGVSCGTCRTWVSGIFHPRHMQVDLYVCYTCGAEWESEPYKI